MTSWRVATCNIRHGLGPDGRVDLARTAEEVRALGADVVGLQEVDVAFGPRSDHGDQAAELGALLGMRVGFGAALDLPPAREGDPRRRYGIALLTRHEILAQEMRLLPAHPGCAPPTEPRGVLHARLRRRDGAQLEVLVTHLDNASRAHRTSQVQGIVRLAEDVVGPAVLMGDMNAEPFSRELAALPATGWRDAAQHVAAPPSRAAGQLEGTLRAELLRSAAGRAVRALLDVTGLRRGSTGGATHPARFPLRRIDALWVRGGIAVSSLEVGPCGSSDHRPVVATLRVGR
ncbi:endonuclease/exonuclease/phosphatase family protein [Brachybacterium fresconis]|uniref:Endonuclease/exonuclease/phosphatase family metal-dependent hydrolase n=1 Tax=Brachybacterium fresconis TaxID=173363 RepID=A0ABS4YPV6_9MICO|nr:endonuclease/exonuclease/phosphatase family protein [Brachybacterium fresconis]MBP2410836.1 endonuclease/exonuclease/phosphatase family metal-dependent hydrolase [Brachybacterium fresconis]